MGGLFVATFGKHKGKTVEEIFEIDKDYCQWIIKQSGGAIVNLASHIRIFARERYQYLRVMSQVEVDFINPMVLTFGKYKGKIVDNIFKDDPKYFDWIFKEMVIFDDDFAITIIKLEMYIENIKSKESEAVDSLSKSISSIKVEEYSVKSPSSYDETFRLFKEGYNEISIANILGIREVDVQENIFYLIKEGKIKGNEIDISVEVINKVIEAVNSLGGYYNNLKSIREVCDINVSYRDIRYSIAIFTTNM